LRHLGDELDRTAVVAGNQRAAGRAAQPARDRVPEDRRADREADETLDARRLAQPGRHGRLVGARAEQLCLQRGAVVELQRAVVAGGHAESLLVVTVAEKRGAGATLPSAASRIAAEAPRATAATAARPAARPRLRSSADGVAARWAWPRMVGW